MSCNYDEYLSNVKVSYGVYNNLIIDCIYYLKCYSFCIIFRSGVYLLCNLFISIQYKYGWHKQYIPIIMWPRNSNNYHYKVTDIFNDIDPDLNFMLNHIEDQCVNYDIESFKKVSV